MIDSAANQPWTWRPECAPAKALPRILVTGGTTHEGRPGTTAGLRRQGPHTHLFCLHNAAQHLAARRKLGTQDGVGHAAQYYAQKVAHGCQHLAVGQRFWLLQAAQAGRVARHGRRPCWVGWVGSN